MGDNQSTVNDMTVCQDTTAVNSVSENNKPTVENPKVRQLTTACFVVFDRYEFYWQRFWLWHNYFTQSLLATLEL